MKISTTRKNIQIVRPLLNYKKKEIITVTTPSGEKTFEITEVKYI